MADYASESGHWYDADGTPRYTIVGKNGKERASTLRDAREHGWVPSVTTIIGCAAKFGLEKWKAEQLLLAGLTLPRLDGEAESDWIARVWEDSKQQAKQAAERGTQIHAAIEAHYAGPHMCSEELIPWVQSINMLLMQTFGYQEWRPEKSFAHALGYGGKVDLHSDSVLLDFKGKDGRDKFKVWHEHGMQLAAYARGLWGNERPWASLDMRAGIIFFDRTEPYCEYHEVKAADLERGWRMFEALLSYWKAANL